MIDKRERKMEKTLNSLYQTVALFQGRKLSISELLQDLALILHSGCEQPDIAAVRIIYGDLEITTPIFPMTTWRKVASFGSGDKIGSIEITYSEPKHISNNYQKSSGEKCLIDSAAILLTLYLEYMDSINSLAISDRDLKLITANVPSIIFIGYTDWSIDVFDDKIEEIAGYSKELFLSRQMKWSDIVLLEDLIDAKRIFIDALRVGKAYVRDYRIKNKHGQIKWIRERSLIHCNQAGKIDNICGVFHDITDRKQVQEELAKYRECLEELVDKRTYELTKANEQLQHEIIKRKIVEDALRESEQLYRTLAENFPNGAVLLLDLNLRCLIAEGKGLLSLGIDKTKIKGESVDTIFPPESIKIIESALKGGEVNFEVTLRQQVWHVYIIPVKERYGKIFAKMVMTQNITERKRIEERLREAATIDTITGLFNRRHLFEVLNINAKYSKRYGAHLCLCMCDIDGFKAINDIYGHRTGDMVLSHYGTIIKENIRETDSAGRYGGDEFCIVLPNTETEGAQILIERIRVDLAGMLFQAYDGTTFHITGSFGLAKFNNEDEDTGAIELMERADKALYEAKQSGKNKVVLAA